MPARRTLEAKKEFVKLGMTVDLGHSRRQVIEMNAQLMELLKAAMKAKDSTALNALRALKTALTNAAIEKGHLNAELTEDEQLNVVQKQIKQRRDSIELFEQAGRPEMAAKEQEEIRILEQFMPQQLSAEELEVAVKECIQSLGAQGKGDMGKVMAALKDQVGRRAEGKAISAAVMKHLS